MDVRISRWAKTLVNYCLELQAGQSMWIIATPEAEELVAEVHREVLRAGGHTAVQLSLDSLTEISLQEASDEQLSRANPVTKLLAETADARLYIESESLTRFAEKSDPAREALLVKAASEARKIANERSLDGRMRWCLTLFPTAAYAQEAGMSLDDFREFVYDACFLNSEDPAERWRELGRQQQFYVDWLVGKREIHVVGPDTDLHVRIDGRIFRNSDGKRNFPSGEFFTSPLENSAEGHIRFTVPSVVNGHLVEDIQLDFEKGQVVQSRAATGADYLKQMLAMDAGASRVGEFAFGNNFGITRGIKKILFDEKLGGTIHMAMGNSYAECGGKNTSALHWDMVCDLREAAGGGEVYVDDVLFLKDGKLVVKP